MVSSRIRDKKWLSTARVELHESTKSSSALNLPTPGDTRCKFIDSGRSRLGILLVPHGDRRPSWQGQRPGPWEERKNDPRSFSTRSIWSFRVASFFARARNAV